MIADRPTAGAWRGLAGIAKGWRGFVSGWEHVHTVVDEYRELDDERVLVFIRQSGRGKTSGFEVGETGTREANLFHIRDGRVTRLVLDEDRDRALADLGLEA